MDENPTNATNTAASTATAAASATSGTGATADDAVLHFTVSGRIDRPVAEVFEAVVDPDQLSQYFTTGGAVGRLETGSLVQWDFADFPGAFPVRVVEVTPTRRIVLRWGAAEGTSANVDSSATGGAEDDEVIGPYTTVTMEFEQLEDGRTLVTISETGWTPTDAGRQASYGNCEGWTGALIALKVWLEHRINLREGFYK